MKKTIKTIKTNETRRKLLEIAKQDLVKAHLLWETLANSPDDTIKVTNKKEGKGIK